MTLGLADKIVSLHESLEAAGVPHAFGGALALAYCILEPRTTQDIDLNVFASTHELAAVESALPRGVKVTVAARRAIERDGQARVFWATTPVDLFFSNHAFHDQARANVRVVPFGDTPIPVLACADLAVFKAFFDRPKDAVDVAAMVSAGAVRIDALEQAVEALLGTGERVRFFERVREFASEA